MMLNLGCTGVVDTHNFKCRRNQQEKVFWKLIFHKDHNYIHDITREAVPWFLLLSTNEVEQKAFYYSENEKVGLLLDKIKKIGLLLDKKSSKTGMIRIMLRISHRNK